MKALLIGMSMMLCLYSAQNLNTNKPRSSACHAADTETDDSIAYGPQLPAYYNHGISEYVRRVFEDSRGFLWFGTNSDGLALFDGNKLSYLNSQDGLSGSQITGIIEDKEGKVWFSTNNGISRYDISAETGEYFQNFGEREGLCHKSTWSIFQDSKGTIWAGTLSGLCRFNGKDFEVVSIPTAEKSWIRSITEDKEGNLWFATADKGAFKFDGKSFQQLSIKDGLCSNDLTCIIQDKQGNMWFGSMDGGLSIYDGKNFRNLTTEKEIGGNEVWTIYEDPNGGVWFSSEGFGLYRYTSAGLEHFGEKQGFNTQAVQTVYRDRFERLWIGGGGGLVRFTRGTFQPVTKDGPWTDGC